MFRKMKSLSIVIAAFLLLLTACGPDRNEGGNPSSQPPASPSGSGSPTESASPESELPPKPKELTIWASRDKVAQEVVKSFEEQTGIKVNVVKKDMFEQKDQLALDGPAGLGPDIFYQPHDGLGQEVLEGLVQPIELDEVFMSQFLPKAIDAFKYDGKMWGVPLTVDTFALFYNKKLVPTPPATMAELEEIADKLTNASKDEFGFLIDPGNFYFSYSYMAGYGGYIFGKDAEGNYNPQDLGLNNDGAIQGAKLIQKWIQKGYVPQSMNGEIGSALFGEGKVGAVVSGPWSVQSFRDTLGDDLGVATIPALDNGVIPPSFTGVKGWMLSYYSKEPYWATELMKHLSSKEASLLHYQQTGDIPANKELMESDLITQDPIVSGFAEQIKHGEITPNIPAMTQVWLGTYDAMVFIVQGQDPKPLLDSSVKTITEAIAMQESQK